MGTEKRAGFFRQRLLGLQRRWQGIAGSGYGVDMARFHPALPDQDLPRLLQCMGRALEAPGGEISARAQAAALGRAYLDLDTVGRGRFLKLLAEEFDLEEEDVVRAAEELRRAKPGGEQRDARRALRETLVSPRTRILTRFNALPQGVKFLVDLRADLLPLARKDPSLAALDDDLKGLLTTWFDVDFLQLRRISWNTASGALLEKFMAYEAVHPVESWEDLKNRLDFDRRYFAFFHPRMPEEPLIFLEVALVKELSGKIQELLDPGAPAQDPTEANTAIFYSISNAQPGLAGVSFGGFLIKRVVTELVREFPGLKTFSTLSPLPGFRGWLLDALSKSEVFVHPRGEKRLRGFLDGEDPAGWLAGVVDGRLWLEDPDVEKVVRPILMGLAAQYLIGEKRLGGGARDPVAHFHLSNGARIERLNWAGDLSERGLDQSAGIMVNYRYDQKNIEANHESYRGTGEVVCTAQVRGLLKD